MLLKIKGGKLRLIGVIAELILGKEGFHELGFNVPRSKIMAQQAVMLNRVEEELPSAYDVAKADNIELQEITENAAWRIPLSNSKAPRICPCENS